MPQQEDLDEILTHCFIAFGKGIGQSSPSLEIDFEAVRFLRRYYQTRFDKNMRDTSKKLIWRNGVQGALDYGSLLGKTCAERAATNNRVRITIDDVKATVENPDLKCNDRTTHGDWCR
jgi:hypothetical protein